MQSANIRSARATPHVLLGKCLRVFNEPRGISGSSGYTSSMRHARHEVTELGITCGRINRVWCCVLSSNQRSMSTP